ncbi:hypothetical protein [Arthrobacter castelli]|uniref:hypothetical protein n=1 Tax=Arthrobacter castelli TaxID=271431 RepID=UPI0012DF6E7F|nr:hypothetical protein [Arthrobacter castelli]
MKTARIRSFIAGALMANSAPHIATAAAGRRHLTPLAGAASGPVVNGVWAVMNVAGGVLLLRADRAGNVRRWDDDLLAFEAGYLVFAAWMAGSERILSPNRN